MNQVLAFLWNLVTQTIPTWLSRPAPPLPPPPLPPAKPSAPTSSTLDVQARLTQWLESQTEAIGPMPGTGGIIHAISRAVAKSDAALIIAMAAKYHLPISLVTSYVRGESDGDPEAIDPNDQLAKPGETPDEAVAHEDIGIAQLDGAVLEALPQLKGMTTAEIVAKAEDPAWALDVMCQMIVANNVQISANVKAAPWLLDAVPNRDIRIPQANAYNAGVRGTLLTLRTVSPNLAYGIGVVKRADALAPLLDVA